MQTHAHHFFTNYSQPKNLNSNNNLNYTLKIKKTAKWSFQRLEID
jgi:hypothetical protein